VAQADPIPWGNGSAFGAYIRPFSTLGHPNFLAAYLVMTLPIIACFAWQAARQRRRVALVVLVLVGSLSCLGILLSLSRGAGMEIFRDHPLCGCGLDTFPYAFAPKRTSEYWQSEWGATPTKAHNEAIHILATQGLLGAAAVVVLTGGLLVSGVRAWRRSNP